MERFIVGRQFFVVLVLFVTNQCGGALKKDSHVLGLPDSLTQVFLSSGAAMILCTIILSQLTAQVSAANCMLDFINNSFPTFTTYLQLKHPVSFTPSCTLHFRRSLASRLNTRNPHAPVSRTFSSGPRSSCLLPLLALLSQRPCLRCSLERRQTGMAFRVPLV